MKKVFSLWLTAGVWMGVLFYLSSIPNLRAVESNFWDEIIRSGAHLFFYCLGYLLFFRAINFGRKKKNFCQPLAVVFLYGLLDEIHQHFVPTRSFQFKDLLVDFGGALLGWRGAEKLLGK